MMNATFLFAALGIFGSRPHHSVAPIHDPLLINIGLVCRWERSCIGLQHAAMQRSLQQVATSRPPLWKIHLCNRNAARGPYRTDWVGFENCISNRKLKRPRGRRGR
jgi:hypothetical protein